MCRRHRLLHLPLVLAGLLAPAPLLSAEPATTVSLEYGSVPLHSGDTESAVTAPDGTVHFAWRGGIELRSDDARFGGISGLLVSEDGNGLTAVTDTGHWLTANLSYEDGDLARMTKVRMAPLLDLEGNSLAGSKKLGDAEALTRLPDGRLAVAFERRHRVWAYDLDQHGFRATAQAVSINPSLANAENNKGLEALAVLQDGALLAITEGTMATGGVIQGWRVQADDSREIGMRRIRPFDLTDMALLPTGDLLTLERRYSTIGGVGAQIRLVPQDTAQRNMVLDGTVLYRSSAGQTVDNMEGLAVRQDAQGRTLVYLVSDDNFNPLQRTLLLMFELISSNATRSSPAP